MNNDRGLPATQWPRYFRGVLTLSCLRMQKVFSSRLEEGTINEIERLSRRLGISRRQFIEDAIRRHARELHDEEAPGRDIWSETLGAWNRRENVETTIRRARRSFQRGFLRHHRAPNARVRR